MTRRWPRVVEWPFDLDPLDRDARRRAHRPDQVLVFPKGVVAEIFARGRDDAQEIIRAMHHAAAAFDPRGDFALGWFVWRQVHGAVVLALGKNAPAQRAVPLGELYGFST